MNPEPEQDSRHQTPLGRIENSGPMTHEGHKHNGAGHGSATTTGNRPYGGPTGTPDSEKGY